MFFASKAIRTKLTSLNPFYWLKDDDEDELELTRENVELVLDEMRPYLMADG